MSVSFGAATDIIITIFPMPFLKRLQVSKKEKIILVTVFGAGVLYVQWCPETTFRPKANFLFHRVCVSALLRLGALVKLEHNFNDWSYYAAEATYWASIESNLAIVCASLPTLRPLLVYVYPRFGGSQQFTSLSTPTDCRQPPSGFSNNPYRQPVENETHIKADETGWKLERIPSRNSLPAPSVESREVMLSTSNA